MTEPTTQTENRGNALRLKRHRDRKHAQGEAALFVYLPADLIEVIDAEKAQHALPGRAEAVVRMMAELQTYRSGEGEDRA